MTITEKLSDEELQSVEVVVLTQDHPRRLPFDPLVDGFDHGWWIDRSAPPNREQFEWLSFTLDGREVGRAEVNVASRAHRDYATPALPDEVVEIVFIEARNDLLGMGIGPEMVARIVGRHPARAFVASSVDAEGFWRDGMRWPEFARTQQQPVGNSIFVLNTRGF